MSGGGSDSGEDGAEGTSPIDLLVAGERTPSPHSHVGAAAVSTGRTFEQLFASSRVPAADESAAKTLASAFAPRAAVEAQRSHGQGRPARVAESELSLSNVFREPSAPSPTRSEGAGFSFDQFFSAPVGAYDDATVAAHATPAGERGKAASDIEQFTAWLEGLKKK